MDAILAFIGAVSLSDDEYESIDLDAQVYDSETYQALLVVLNSRELVSNTVDRLRAYFIAKGVAVTEPDQGVSKIYLGSAL